MSPIENKEFTGPSNLSALDRRDFMKYMGLFSSMTLLSNCSKKADHITPYAQEISEFSQKNYEFYQTTFNTQGFSQGISVKSFQGRPIKVEGNFLHPYSLGSTTPAAQASIYELYHPGRVTNLRWKGQDQSVEGLVEKINQETAQWGNGQGVVFFYRPDHSPTQLESIKRLQKKYPRSHWTSLSPWKRDTAETFDLEKADVVVSFDEDLFYGRPDALVNSRHFMERRMRAIHENKSLLNRLEVFESTPSLLGAKADHTEVLRPEVIWNDACDLLDMKLGKEVKNPRMERILNLIKGKEAVFSVGRHLSPEALELEVALNSSSSYKAIKHDMPETHRLFEIKSLISQGKIHTIISLGENPFEEEELELKKVPLKISLGLFPNKTHKESDVQLGESHFFESWGDLKTPRGDVSLIQPLINPMYKTLSILEFLLILEKEPSSAIEILKKKYGTQWNEALQKGILSSSEKLTSFTSSQKTFSRKKTSNRLTIKILPDPSVGFGEGAENPVLQELPKNFSKLTWQNALMMSAETATSLGVQDGDHLKLKTSHAETSGPVKILPGVAQNLILATLGYGEKDGSFIKKKRGYSLKNFTQGEEIEAKKSSGQTKLALTQETLFTPGQGPVKTTTLPLAQFKEKKLPSLYPSNPLPHQDQGPQWGMTIDLTSCIGCQACVVSCQVENNIPFVGEEQVQKGRILHWLRIDTYRVNENTFFQPVPCMHCEKAPCEVVCPVNATVHGNGGLNEMVYNRCVGTRYCSNNCPYKVRKFNFGAYSTLQAPWSMGFNPEVSVRERGVMEKCTYCIQKIKEGEHSGTTVTTACQSVCPTKAIDFGDIRDPKSQVSLNKKSSRNYDLLEDEGTIPRTSYLKVVRL